MATRKPFRAREALGSLFAAVPPTAPATAPPEGTLTPSSQPLSVSQLSERVVGAIDAAFPERLAVVGEVSRPTNKTHLYFRLKDERCVVEAICYRGDIPRLTVQPREGDKVLVRGRLGYWAEGGRLTLRVDAMEHVGEGALDAKLRLLKEALLARGWLDASVKRPLPLHPRRIAIVTSRTSAALQDCLVTARHRLPSTEILVVDVRVQGNGVEHEIAAAIRAVDGAAARLGIDAIVLTRGGGSLEDLWCFNEEVVARALHEARIPIVAAIGHEIDTTIAELVADCRAATPTAAIIALLPDRAALREELAALQDRVRRGFATQAAARRDALRAIATRPCLVDPAAPIHRQRELLREVVRRMQGHAASRVARAVDAVAAERDRLRRAIPARLAQARGSMDGLGGRLAAVDPYSVLERGYAMVANDEGVITSATAMPTGGQVSLVFCDGAREAVLHPGSPVPMPARTHP